MNSITLLLDNALPFALNWFYEEATEKRLSDDCRIDYVCPNKMTVYSKVFLEFWF